MKYLKKVAFSTAGGLAVSLVLTFMGSSTALAVGTVPALGAAATFSVLSNSAMSSALSTITSGDVGLSTGVSSSFTGAWTVGGTKYFGPLTLAANAQTAALAASNNLIGQTPTALWSLNPAPAPGVYNAPSDATFAGTLTLTGTPADVWVFQITDDFTFTGNVVLAGGAQACNVFWRVAQDATINSGGGGSAFVGTLIAGRDVSLVGGPTINGRILSGFTGAGALTTAGNTNISGPTCAATINVAKIVVNDNGRTNVIADFPLFVNAVGVTSGVTNTFTVPATYTVTETSNVNYTSSFSGVGCTGGVVNLVQGDAILCVITNDDIATPTPTPGGGGGGGGGGGTIIPPLIDLVKIPSPLSLPGGPGPVTYTYTVRNIGTVTMTDVTLTDDTCSPATFVSGDTDSDTRLDLDEVWTYSCSTTLQATRTNTATATGWANGISSVDIANATVIVGAPVTPPLIHVTKVPSPLFLLVGGGSVTYTERISNPGVVALSNVRLVDDKCSPVTFNSGDTNGDGILDTTETWNYTCTRNLTQTTTNTATATGVGNGITVTDFAIATVVVGVPGLPSTGVPPAGNNTVLGIAMLIGIFTLVSTSLAVVLRERAM